MFDKIWSWGILPETDKDGNFTFFRVPTTQWIEPNKLHSIALGIWVPRLPENTLVWLQDIHPRFSLVNHYLTASLDEIRISLVTEYATFLEKNTRLCKITLINASTLLPGKNLIPPTFHFYKKNTCLNLV